MFSAVLTWAALGICSWGDGKVRERDYGRQLWRRPGVLSLALKWLLISYLLNVITNADLC